MPQNFSSTTVKKKSLIENPDKVRQTGKPNFLGTYIPVMSQLNVEVWEDLLKEGLLGSTAITDAQVSFLILTRIVHCIMNRVTTLQPSSFPKDVDAYIQEECKY